MINPKLISNFCWWYFFLILATALAGVVFIYSANHGRPEAFFRHLYVKQLYWVLYGLIVMIFAICVDYRFLNRYAYLFYGLTLLALGYVLINGVVASGAKRWIRIGPLTLQISEFAKFALIIALAKYFGGDRSQGKYRLRDLFIPTVLTLTIGLMIASQPDLGTAMIIFFLFLIFITAIEIDYRTLLKLFSVGKIGRAHV